MIPVAEALDRLFALAPALPSETVPLIEAAGRVLAAPVSARRDQPPFAASSMDGYAVRDAAPGQRLRVVGAAQAGARYTGPPLAAGEAVRIFTGAPLPEGATRVVIQEDTARDGDTITLAASLEDTRFVRPAGNDFAAGFAMAAPRLLGPADIALLAAMNVATVPVTRRPDVAIIGTGDELVAPGETPGPDQIVASNTFGLHALLRALGAAPRLLPIARDTPEALRTVLGLAEGADLIVTIGGASVGDHDLVAGVVAELGLEPAFHTVAMRPGKPLMSGRLGDAMLIGLPGNPVSAMVCGHVFVAPVIRAMLGLGAAPAPRLHAPLATALPANGPREHYMRATRTEAGIAVAGRQDSGLLSVLAQADALVVRPPHDPARPEGAEVAYIAL